jgi:hypothetical protein
VHWAETVVSIGVEVLFESQKARVFEVPGFVAGVA